MRPRGQLETVKILDIDYNVKYKQNTFSPIFDKMIGRDGQKSAKNKIPVKKLELDFDDINNDIKSIFSNKQGDTNNLRKTL